MDFLPLCFNLKDYIKTSRTTFLSVARLFFVTLFFITADTLLILPAATFYTAQAAPQYENSVPPVPPLPGGTRSVL